MSSLFPKSLPMMEIDFLKIAFFTISLHEHDKVIFAFSVPTYTSSCPIKRYHWKVLPQEMLNSPTLC